MPESTQPRSALVLPDVATENAEAWRQVEASGLGDRMKRALQRVAAGEPFRAAAQAG